jgi:4-hydroxy-3-methylbut-2-enyl diphosphate reductase
MRDKKITVIVGKPAGFCSGVKRAIAIAKKEGRANPGQVYTLGSIVHNAQVVNELKKLNVKTIGMNQLKPQTDNRSVIVIRSHGCAPQVINKIRKLGYKLVDATCPIVRKVQNYAQQLKDGGYVTIVIGDKNHPEVKGIIGYAKPQARVYDANTKGSKSLSRVGIVGQTTIPFRVFTDSINTFNITDYSEVRIFNTLCKESINRQKTCKKIADIVNLMIVVGSRNSANTASLVDIARKSRTKVHLVENRSELQKKWFSDLQRTRFADVEAGRVGVIAGASTPENTVFEVVQDIKKFTTREKNDNGR